MEDYCSSLVFPLNKTVLKDHIKEIRPIVIWAFLLNTIWEFGQCLFLYDMWDWPFWKATFWMWAAIIGDVFIVLGLWKLTELLFSPVNFEKLKLKDYLYLIFISFFASIVLEWGAKFLELWTYSDLMPILTIFDYEVGLSPIIQITFLPALSVYFSVKRYH